MIILYINNKNLFLLMKNNTCLLIAFILIINIIKSTYIPISVYTWNTCGLFLKDKEKF